MKRALMSLTVLSACDSGSAQPEPASVPAAAQPAEAKQAAAAAPSAGAGPIVDHNVQTLAGEPKKLSDYRGKALLVVNTASQCGYTPQYEGLQQLYGKYKERGFEVLGFPSNDFGQQEPGSSQEIAQFVAEKYGVEFPMFAKVSVKGDSKIPLYKTLTEETAEGIRGEVKWNFTKFLVDPSGQVIARFDSNVDPMDAGLVAKLESVLPKA